MIHHHGPLLKRHRPIKVVAPFQELLGVFLGPDRYPKGHLLPLQSKVHPPQSERKPHPTSTESPR